MSTMDGDQGPGDATRLRSALEVANIPTLLLVLAHLTGDERWLDEPYRPRRAEPLSDNDTAGLPESLQREVREAAYDAILASEGAGTAIPPIDVGRIAGMLSAALTEDVPEEYGELLAEELGLVSRDVGPLRPPGGFRAVVIGAGMSGICMAVKLEAAGIDYVVLEKDPDLGGTWLENVYPGCGVDTPSHFYSFSFEPNAEWSRYFPKRDEVWNYFARIADSHGIRRRIRFSTEVAGAEYDSDRSLWRVRARDADGREFELETPVLISAVGQVNRPSVPPIEGIEDFTGPVMHTARWRREVDLAGKRVAVVGTGASAMQLVPAIADEAARVLVFQRTKQWALPHPNYSRDVPEGVRYLMSRVPLYARWYRLRTFWNFGDRLYDPLLIDPDWPHQDRSINAANEKHRVFLSRHIERELGERTDLLDDCVPDYPPYVKRPLLDNGWFRTVARPDVDLITEGIAKVTASGVVTESGEEHEVDVIALATGFKILQFLWPMEIRGSHGKTLRQVWGEDDARAYLGVTVPGFPNFFVINGPNTFAGHGGSAIIATEFEVRYTMQAIRRIVEAGLASVDVREDVFWDYNKEVDEMLARMIWSHTKTSTYFRNDAGRIVVNSPWKYIDYWARTKDFEPGDYEEVPKEVAS
ncbi:NAD(P)/FAD-dependent oxidoreductase [Amycolatopsis acidicola]|uniref:NAD(P)/FAD-dependent oxidoreductase n=1 Tax=Amycolatopsis acidicola TaxID=2596893 RepID=A0A5N0V3Z9_9PSEU|nr:NAD(P)/FAD-dependent oxidoreductase [Amycolatopsis acidicola]KAA9160514.1 NAD(P)/FAD-dependent oxidoreductase [Amycolatopsis acidicola]